MTTSANNDLFEQIRAKCQREHWYGGDLLSPKNLLVLEQDASRFGFSFSPANEVQLRQTEARLGFALPTSLRELYLHVANGGFGPGAGLRGVIGGYSDYDDDNTLAACYLSYTRNSCIPLSDAILEHKQSRKKIHRLPNAVWPCQLLLLLDLGCTQQICIDPQEALFLTAPSEHEDYYQLVQLPWTLTEWLWRWIRNEELLPITGEAA